MGSILKFSIINSKNISWESDQLLVFLVEKNRPSQYFKKWQSLTRNNINNIIENASFSFKFGQDLLVRSSKNSILLFGYGATRKTNLDYEKIAIELANDKSKILKFKNKIKNEIKDSYVFQSKKFTNDLENLYLKIIENITVTLILL